MAFDYQRTVRFGDTDAAGVVYFASTFNYCHEAYEASLAASGINLEQFFSRSGVAVPIVHAEAGYFQPLRCGESVQVCLVPQQDSDASFSIVYTLYMRSPDGSPSSQTTLDLNNPVEQNSHLPISGGEDCLVSKASTKHVAIDPKLRRKVALPPELREWLKRWG
ncbi:MAG: thioesterase family protein [Cyanobacteria bacterium P01_E01_bin.34]